MAPVWIVSTSHEFVVCTGEASCKKTISWNCSVVCVSRELSSILKTISFTSKRKYVGNSRHHDLVSNWQQNKFFGSIIILARNHEGKCCLFLFWLLRGKNQEDKRLGVKVKVLFIILGERRLRYYNRKYHKKSNPQ